MITLTEPTDVDLHARLSPPSEQLTTEQATLLLRAAERSPADWAAARRYLDRINREREADELMADRRAEEARGDEIGVELWDGGML